MITLEGIAKRHNEWIKMSIYLGATMPEDVVQDMYLKLAIIQSEEGNLNRFEYKEGVVNTMYIFKIIQSRVVDEHRQKKHQQYDEVLFNPITPLDEAEKSYAELMDGVKEVIDTLNEYDQMLLELYFVYGFSLRDIEKRTGIPLHTIFHSISKSKALIKNKTIDKYNEYAEHKSETEEISRTWGFDCEDYPDDGN